jgi:CHAD domain-containing protein
LLTDLRSQRYLVLTHRLIAATRDPRLTKRALQPCLEVLPPLAARAWKRLAPAARSVLPTDPPERYHRVRILAKRTRYAAEAVAPSLPGKARKNAARFADRIAGVQDVLGGLQDAIVARDMVEVAVRVHPGDARLALAAGQMLEREEAVAREARAAFPRVWRRADRKRLRKWLKQ